jgi:DNA polymerase-3 subunit epsilon
MNWLSRIFGKELPKTAFVETYESLFEKPIPPMRPISQLTFVVLDTETTGLDPKKDFIISFGAIKLRSYVLKIDTAQEIYLKTPVKNKEAIQVHEIIDPIEGLTIKDFAKQFLDYIGRDIIVGHHIGFDLLMLEKVLKPFGLKKLLNPVLDTQYLAMRLEKGPHYDPSMGKPGEYSLDNLCERYGIELDDRHTAAGDAFLTGQLLLRLLKMAERKGIKDFGTLMR